LAGRGRHGRSWSMCGQAGGAGEGRGRGRSEREASEPSAGVRTRLAGMWPEGAGLAGCGGLPSGPGEKVHRKIKAGADGGPDDADRPPSLTGGLSLD
jgi:hypothetical protein